MTGTIHGTCVALGNSGALLRGPSGAGKSDLALRFLYLPADRLGASPVLIADDRVILRQAGGSILASCPPLLAGMIEVRGLGIMHLPFAGTCAELKLIADLDSKNIAPRFPEDDQWETVFDVPIRRIFIDPFELAAPIKLALAIINCSQAPVD